MVKFVKKYKRIFLCVCVLLIVFLVFGLYNALKVVTYTIETEKIANPVKIALVTDLHSCKHGENQEDLIDAINEANPDVVLLGGDIYDDVLPNENTSIVLGAISEKYPCYYVTGNHEYWSDDIETFLELVESFGITVLDGSYETIEVNGQSVNICGITDPDVLRYTEGHDDIRQQLDNLADVNDNGNYTILLAHRPELIDTYREYDFDLVLSGHAHGGQWRIPGLINGVLAPNQGWFPKYAGGLYEFKDMDFIVSRGLSRESTRVPRFFNRPELVLIELE